MILSFDISPIIISISIPLRVNISIKKIMQIDKPTLYKNANEYFRILNIHNYKWKLRLGAAPIIDQIKKNIAKKLWRKRKRKGKVLKIT